MTWAATSDDLDKEVSALVEKVAAALRERDERINALLAFIGKPGDMSYEEVVKENDRLAQARDMRTAVLEAYKAHHEMFHPECNISGPPSPPSRLRQ